MKWLLTLALTLTVACSKSDPKREAPSATAAEAPTKPAAPPRPKVTKDPATVTAAIVAAKQTPSNRGKWAATLYAGEDVTILRGGAEVMPQGWVKVRLGDDETEAFIEEKYLGLPGMIAVVTQDVPAYRDDENWLMPCPREDREGLSRGQLVIESEGDAGGLVAVKIPSGRTYYVPPALLEDSEEVVQMGRAVFAFHLLMDKGKSDAALDILGAADALYGHEPMPMFETEELVDALDDYYRSREAAGWPEERPAPLDPKQMEMMQSAAHNVRTQSRIDAATGLLAGEWKTLTEYKEGRFRFETMACSPIEEPIRLIVDEEKRAIIYGPDRSYLFQITDATLGPDGITFSGTRGDKTAQASFECYDGPPYLQKKLAIWDIDQGAGPYAGPWASDDFKTHEEACHDDE